MMNPMYGLLGITPPPLGMPPSVGQGFVPPVRPLGGQGPIPGSQKFFRQQFGPGTRVTLPGGFSSGLQALKKSPPGTLVGL